MQSGPVPFSLHIGLYPGTKVSMNDSTVNRPFVKFRVEFSESTNWKILYKLVVFYIVSECPLLNRSLQKPFVMPQCSVMNGNLKKVPVISVVNYKECQRFKHSHTF